MIGGLGHGVHREPVGHGPVLDLRGGVVVVHFLHPDPRDDRQPFPEVDLAHDVSRRMDFIAPVIIPGMSRDGKNRGGLRIDIKHLCPHFVHQGLTDHVIHPGPFVIHVSGIGLIVIITKFLEVKDGFHRFMMDRIGQPVRHAAVYHGLVVLVILQSHFIVIPVYPLVFRSRLQVDVYVFRDPQRNLHVEVPQPVLLIKCPGLVLAVLGPELIIPYSRVYPAVKIPGPLLFQLCIRDRVGDEILDDLLGEPVMIPVVVLMVQHDIRQARIKAYDPQLLFVPEVVVQQQLGVVGPGQVQLVVIQPLARPAHVVAVFRFVGIGMGHHA